MKPYCISACRTAVKCRTVGNIIQVIRLLARALLYRQMREGMYVVYFVMVLHLPNVDSSEIWVG